MFYYVKPSSVSKTKVLLKPGLESSVIPLYESKLYELKLYEMQLYESKLYEMLLSPFSG